MKFHIRVKNPRRYHNTSLLNEARKTNPNLTPKNMKPEYNDLFDAAEHITSLWEDCNDSIAIEFDTETGDARVMKPWIGVATAPGLGMTDAPKETE